MLYEVITPTYTPLIALGYVTLNTPIRFYELVPVALLIGSLFAWNRFALASEFNVMRTAGLSMNRLLGWMLALGIRITSYNVCYTKLLRRSMISTRPTIRSSAVAYEARNRPPT